MLQKRACFQSAVRYAATLSFTILIGVLSLCCVSKSHAQSNALATKPGEIMVTFRISANSNAPHPAKRPIRFILKRLGLVVPQEARVRRGKGYFGKNSVKQILIRSNDGRDLAGSGHKLVRDRLLKRRSILILDASPAYLISSPVIQEESTPTPSPEATETSTPVQTPDITPTAPFYTATPTATFTPEPLWPEQRPVAARAQQIVSADADQNGCVNQADYTIAKSNFGRTDVGIAGGDFNLNGTVDAADYTLWRDTLGQGCCAAGQVDGDADLDCCVTQTDHQIWKNNFGRTLVSPKEGDFNGDGTVDAADYSVWRDNMGVCGLSDECPNDTFKTTPGACGCGTGETDVNNNGVPDCREDGSLLSQLTDFGRTTLNIAATQHCAPADLFLDAYCMNPIRTGEIDKDVPDVVSLSYDLALGTEEHRSAGVEFYFDWDTEKWDAEYYIEPARLDASSGVTFAFRSLSTRGSAAALKLIFEDSAGKISTVVVGGISSNFRNFNISAGAISQGDQTGMINVTSIRRLTFLVDPSTTGDDQGRGIVEIKAKNLPRLVESSPIATQYEPCVSAACETTQNTVSSFAAGENGYSFAVDLRKGAFGGIELSFKELASKAISASDGLMLALSTSATSGNFSVLRLVLTDSSGKKASFNLSGLGSTLTNFVVRPSAALTTEADFDYEKIASAILESNTSLSGANSRGSVYLASISGIASSERLEVSCRAKLAPLVVPVSGPVEMEPQIGSLELINGGSAVRYRRSLAEDYGADTFSVAECAVPDVVSCDRVSYLVSYESCASSQTAGGASNNNEQGGGGSVTLLPRDENIAQVPREILDDSKLEEEIFRYAAEAVKHLPHDGVASRKFDVKRGQLGISVAQLYVPLEGTVLVYSIHVPEEDIYIMAVAVDLSGSERYSFRSDYNKAALAYAKEYSRSISWIVDRNTKKLNALESETGRADIGAQVRAVSAPGELQFSNFGADEWRVKIESHGKWVETHKVTIDRKNRLPNLGYDNEDLYKETDYEKNGDVFNLKGKHEKAGKTVAPENIHLSESMTEWRDYETPIKEYSLTEDTEFIGGSKSRFDRNDITTTRDFPFIFDVGTSPIEVRSIEKNISRRWDEITGELLVRTWQRKEILDRTDQDTFNQVLSSEKVNFDNYLPSSAVPVRARGKSEEIFHYAKEDGSYVDSVKKESGVGYSLESGNKISDSGSIDIGNVDPTKSEKASRSVGWLHDGTLSGASGTYQKHGSDTYSVTFGTSGLPYLRIYTAWLPAGKFPDPNAAEPRRALKDALSSWLGFIGGLTSGVEGGSFPGLGGYDEAEYANNASIRQY